jgi:hypothetical protein
MLRKSAPVLALAAAMGLLLSACGGGQGASDTSAAQAPQTTAQAPASAPTRKAAPALTASQLASALDAGKVRTWTAEDDPNKLLGRPGGYTSAATVVDKRVDCDDPKEPGASCGATVEVFASAAAAKARSDYIQAILSGGGAFGTEYHTLAGPALLRVTGELTPAQASKYAARFTAEASK